MTVGKERRDAGMEYIVLCLESCGKNKAETRDLPLTKPQFRQMMGNF